MKSLEKTSFFYSEETYPKNGLIYYLYSEYKDFYNSIVVSATSSVKGSDPRNTIDFTSKYWHGDVGPRANITFFIPFPIKIIGYTIQTSDLSPGSNICHPKEWIFSVSEDGETKLYSQKYDDSITGEMNIKNTHKYIEFKHHGTYQFFHIDAINSYCDQARNFDLNEFDVYGTIDMHNKEKCTYSHFRLYHLIQHIYILLIFS